MKLYLSGAISAFTPEEEEKNIAYFMEREKVWKIWFPEVHNPARFAHSNWSWTRYLARDLHWIQENRPALMMLLGWQKSRGARLERYFAQELGLMVLYEQTPPR